jgi:hypothetical protein
VTGLQSNRGLAFALAAGCLLCAIPGTMAQSLPAPAKNSVTPNSTGTNLSSARLRPGVYPAQPVPPEFAVPPTLLEEDAPIDWSIGLRGTYSQSNGTGSYVSRLLPRVSYSRSGTLLDTVFEASGDLAKTSTYDTPILASGQLSVSSSMALDPTTTATAGLSLGLTQDLPGAPGVSTNVIVPPQVFTGAANVGLERSFGNVNLGGSLAASRTLYGQSTRNDTGTTDNTDQNYWSGAATLRLGYQITPIFEVFGEGELQRDVFDIATPGTDILPNATNRSLRAGISGKWNDVWKASASVGVGERVFDDSRLGKVEAQLYGAEVTYAPDPTLTLRAGLETALAPAGADSEGRARVQYTAFADAQYLVNTWLRLRASADWSHSELVGTGTTEKRLGLGAGADYALSAHTSLNADYGYGNTDNSNGNTQTHQVSLGVTVSR